VQSGNYDPRPPEDRDLAGTIDPKRTSRVTRRSKATSETNPAADGMLRRLSGRSDLDRAKAMRYEPYSYESNSTQLRWVVISLAAWSVVALWLAWVDFSTLGVLSDLQDQGFTSVPPATLTPQSMIEFADREGMSCIDAADVFLATNECNRLFDAQNIYEGVKGQSSLAFVTLMGLLLVNMFAFGSFTHRASRNLLTLKSSGQGFTPEKAVMWFFIPFMNLYKPWQVFRELFKGSDPLVTTSDKLKWKTAGKVSNLVHFWAGIFVLVFIYNPITIGRVWHSVRLTFTDSVIAHQRLVIADLLLALLGIAALLVVIELHKRQELRHVKVGNITVTPPPPVDPLHEALKEGIRRKELDNRNFRLGGHDRKDER
tara:strand:- start:14726 stop:15838 length:1113 start_codon:yes stop_codon:yes gene_type:complete